MSSFRKKIEKSSLESLLKLEKKASDSYYNSGDPLLSDEEYDLLRDEIIKRGYSFPDKKVGHKLREGDNKVTLPVWMGSANKISFGENDSLKRWLDRNRAESYLVTDKLDGVSCLFVSKGGKIFLYTRGDGEEGSDISHIARFIKNLPKKLSENIMARGELIMKRKSFNRFHKKTYKNPRNMVSGLVNAKTERRGLSDLDFIVYELIEDEQRSQSEQKLFLDKLGFTFVHCSGIKRKDITMEKLSNILKKRKIESEYDLDGIIVQVDEPYERNTSGNPSYMFAFKMQTEESIKDAVVEKVEWNTSQWGYLKPVVILKNPVETGDVTISRVTAFNAKYVEENGIGPGAVIKVTRSKEVIPYIVKVVKGVSPEFPDIPFTWNKNHVDIIADKDDDSACIAFISNFFSKIGCKFVSDATVKKLYKHGLNTVIKIIRAEKKDFLKIDTIEDKSAERIYTNIKNSLKEISVSTLIGASGIFGYGVGRRKVEEIVKKYPDFFSVKRSEKELRKLLGTVEGFAEITIDKVVPNVKYAFLFLQALKGYISLKQNIIVNQKLSGKYVFSGFRDKDLEEKIIASGGKVTTSVSKQTTALIVKSLKESTSKIEAAKKNSIPIYVIGDFRDKFFF